MQGIYLYPGRRPASKKEVKQAVAENPEHVGFEATSMFGGDFEGTAAQLQEGQRVDFVGPDPHTSRKFYGTIKRTAKGLVVT